MPCDIILPLSGMFGSQPHIIDLSKTALISSRTSGLSQNLADAARLSAGPSTLFRVVK
jgi:hypothetical protein